MMSGVQLSIEEYDDVGNITATFVQTATDREGLSRIDIVVSLSTNLVPQTQIAQRLTRTFEAS